MATLQERQLNQDAFRSLKKSIEQSYAPGRFVAITAGQIVADADRFDEVVSMLRAAGKNPADVLIVQAGAEHPETAIIFLNGVLS